MTDGSGDHVGRGARSLHAARREHQRVQPAFLVEVSESEGLFVVTAAIYLDTDVTQEMIDLYRREVEAEANLPVKLELFVVHADRIIAEPEEP